MTPRVLGTVGVLGSPMLLVEELASGPSPEARTPLMGALSLVFILCWASSVVGLYRLDGAGARGAGRVVLLAQLLGLGLASVWALLHTLGVPDGSTALYRVTDVAWPFSVLFMLVVGAATARARVLPGWRGLTPLLCGLALPVALLGGALAGGRTAGFVFGVHTTLAWALLGHVVRGAPAPAERPSTARDG